jgi:N-acyl-D-aspartate/D-glutamate deacylase
MESVEDIPGTALHEGIDWRWESVPEYLDALAGMPRVLDVAAQVPHAALRAFVMGERAHEDAGVDEVAEMARITAEAIAAGAVGFSTSRTEVHFSRYGLIPGTVAAPEELLAIAGAMGEVGKGVFQIISDRPTSDEERAWIHEVARRTRGSVTYLLAQSDRAPLVYKDALADAEACRREGLPVVPLVPSRPVGLLFGLQGSMHPFMKHRFWRNLATRPLEERVAVLRTPEGRAALLADEPHTHDRLTLGMITQWHKIFPLGDPPDYEPSPETSAAAVAAREGRRPEEVVLDWLLERDGQALLFAPINYASGDHEVIREMMEHPLTVLGLSDGGAHCGVVCDASMTTFLLTHWARDRRRGPRLPLERVVQMQTAEPAATYRFTDRGTLEPGKRADLNLIDFDGLRLHAPEMRFDLPGGGKRLVQKVDGYRATMVRGEVTFVNGEPTGARPGGLVRS